MRYWMHIKYKLNEDGKSSNGESPGEANPFPNPIPICPFLSPATTMHEKETTLPSIVFLCVCLHALLFPPPNFPFDWPTNNKSGSIGNNKSTI